MTAVRPILGLTVLALLSPQTLLAGWETLVANYMPRLNGQPWPRVPVIAYVETKSNIWVHPSAPHRFPVDSHLFVARKNFGWPLSQLLGPPLLQMGLGESGIR